MNIQSFKNRNGFIVLICLVVALLVFVSDPFKLNYRMKGWKQFGDTPITVNHVVYFIPDTPNVIGYRETASGEMVSCAETVAYVETEAQEMYRCCDTGEKISCEAGEFSSDIPSVDEACGNRLRDILGIPASLPGAQEFDLYGNCAEGASSLVAVQINDKGQILWKSINVEGLNILNSALKCALGPLLLALAAWIIFTTLRGPTNKPIRRF